MADTELQPTKLVSASESVPGSSIAETKVSVDPTPPGSTPPKTGSAGLGSGRTPPLGAGARLGTFRIVGHLGRGGMGDVYRAHDESLDRDVALKTIAPSLVADEEFLERFRAEAKSAARIQHPNVVQVYSAGEAESVLFFAMELVDGRSFGDLLRVKGPFPWQEAARLGAQVARALEAAHAHGVIHRDVKPENILLAPDGSAKVADFGLAKRVAEAGTTASGVIVGTPRYMSPEQAQGETLDQRSDMYSLGATLFHLLAGQPVFDGSSPMKVCLRHIQEAPPRVGSVVRDLPEPFALCIDRLLSKRREDRPATYAELIRELESIARSDSETARLPAATPATPLAATVIQPAPTPTPGTPAPGTPAPGTPTSGTPNTGAPTSGMTPAPTSPKHSMIQVVKRPDGGVEVGFQCPTTDALLSTNFLEARAKAPSAPRVRRIGADLLDLGHLWLTFAAFSLIPFGTSLWAQEAPTLCALTVAYVAILYLTRRGGTIGERFMDVRLVARSGGLPPHTSVGLGYVLAKGFPLILGAVVMNVGGWQKLWEYADPKIPEACWLLLISTALEWGLAITTGRSFRDRVFKARVIDASGLAPEDDWI